MLTFDRPDSAANIFDRDTLLELDEHIAAFGADTKIAGVVFATAKNSIFIAGADLHSIEKLSAADLNSFIDLGQTVFNRIAALKIPTV
ncbi:MAG: fatty-acid oxidation protein subunit alpha, partial [Verrucomicrobiota bacterium]|nr:fatty-acid oxidation protein subunit alpha [Verrucomicrobiota bacterium]